MGFSRQASTTPLGLPVAIHTISNLQVWRFSRFCTFSQRPLGQQSLHICLHAMGSYSQAFAQHFFPITSIRAGFKEVMRKASVPPSTTECPKRILKMRSHPMPLPSYLGTQILSRRPPKPRKVFGALRWKPRTRQDVPKSIENRIGLLAMIQALRSIPSSRATGRSGWVLGLLLGFKVWAPNLGPYNQGLANW